MCGIVGFCDLDNNIFTKDEKVEIIEKMKKTLLRRGPDESGSYISKNVSLGHSRLIVIDPANGAQPMKCTYQGNSYIITYNGQIYNTNELKKELSDNGFTFFGHCDTEVLLKAYIHFGNDVVNKLNGIFAFAIWNENKKELFVARDHFGVKPLFYSIIDNTFIFASEIKALLEYPGIYPVLDSQGISELFGIGPAHTPGTTIFKEIYELKPASFGIFNASGFHGGKYWRLESAPHNDDFNTTCDKVKNLLEDSIERQLVSDVPLCTFLSGGLDSSIITMYASNYYKKHGLGTLDTLTI